MVAPTIVVPGITGTELDDMYSLKQDLVWSGVTARNYLRFTLHPSDPRYELLQPSDVEHARVIRLVYEELIDELRYNLKDKEDEVVPVYAFPYDWRRPLKELAIQLGEFIDEVLGRSLLLKHYREKVGGGDSSTSTLKVNLLGHSMGGLIISGYLASGKAAQSKVDKVVTIATPYKGAVDALERVLTGNSGMTPDGGASREREAARMTPALYHLLPRYAGATKDSNGNSVDIFDVHNWQSTVVSSLAEFVRLHGLHDDKNPENSFQEAQRLLRRFLRDAQHYYRYIDSLADTSVHQEDTLLRDRWLVIGGVGVATRHVATISAEADRRMTLAEPVNEWKGRPSHNTGDGVVPLASVCPPWIDPSRVVLVSPDDVSMWELKNKAINLVAGHHVNMPTINLVIRIITSYLKGSQYGDVQGRRMPSVDRWQPNVPGIREVTS